MLCLCVHACECVYIFIFLISNGNSIQTLKKRVTQAYMMYTSGAQYNQEHKLQVSIKS